MNEQTLCLENIELALKFRLGLEGQYRIEDKKTGEVWESPDLGVVRAWDRTEDRLRPEPLIPDPEALRAIEIEKRSETSGVIHVHLGGRGSIQAMGAFDFGIHFDIEIELRGAAVEISIPEETFEERLTERYEVYSIEILPNLGATPRGNKGYLVIPSWSGAVYYFDREHPRANRSFENPVSLSLTTEEGLARRWGHLPDAPSEYGSLVYGVQGAWEDQIEMGVYATIRDGAGLMGLCIGGAYDTELRAKRDQGKDRKISIHPIFHYRSHYHSKRDPESRKVRLVLLRGEDASYSGVANALREYLIRERGVKPLRERAEENETIRYFRDSIYVRTLFGMTHNFIPSCYLSFQELAEAIPLFREAGFEEVSLIGVGANLGGHDWAHPTVFPFEPAYGGEEGFRKLLETVHGHGYRMGLHTNYKDIYVHSPDYREEAVQHNEWGDFRYHGAWMGGLSHQGIPGKMLELYVKRDFPKLRAMGMHGFWYFDAVGSVMEETFPPGEVITRREYGEQMNAYFEEANKAFGCCGNELSIDTSLGTIVNTGIGYKGAGDPVLDPNNGYCRNGLLDHFIPLQNMVYHGLCFYPGGAEVAGRPGTEYWKKPTLEQLQTLRKSFVESLEWRGKLDDEYFVHHERLAPGVSLSVFSDGTKIYVNRNEAEWKGKGIAVPGKGHRVER